MDKYLFRFKGKYRILAELDLETQDFVKDADGVGFEDSFADFYIKCKSGIKIKHGVGNELSCYIPSFGKGMNILRQLLEDKLSDKIKISHEQDENNNKQDIYCCENDKYLVINYKFDEDTKDYKQINNFDNDMVGKILVKQGILVDCDILDNEIYFIFKTAMIDSIAVLVQPKTSGASISPFSVKNLPKSTYIIPEKDLEIYKISRGNLEMFKINTINKEFMSKYNLKKDKRIKPKEFIHKQGLWNEYCNFIKEFTNED